MARKQVVKLIDDLDGSDIEEGGATVTFSYLGVEYEIDLSDKNARRLDEALSPFVSAARRTGGRRQSSVPANAVPDRTQLAAMRSWARDHGFQVSDRGRVSQEIQAAYHAAV